MVSSSGKESFPLLASTEAAGHASRRILRHLLHTLQQHQQALLQGQNGENLHDFRVAVRRSRCALRQIRPVYLPSAVQPYADGFAELSRITCAVRDGEVYLSAFAALSAALDSPLQNALAPMQSMLAKRHALARQQLLAHLQSAAHGEFLADWEAFLCHSGQADEAEGAQQTLQPLANRRLHKLYRRVVREGAAIDASAPPQALHELRKTCKKLRYLLEFFHGLYPAKPHRHILRQLKALQDILGEYQDCQVQAATLLHLAEAEDLKGASPLAYLAMGVLYQRLQEQAEQSRGRFADAYALLAAEPTRRSFAALV